MVIFGSGEIITTYWSLELGKYVVFKNTPSYYRTLRSNALFIQNHDLQTAMIFFIVKYLGLVPF